MESRRSVKYIARSLGEYISSVSPQTSEQGQLQYYMCGSLATMLLANATSIEECNVIDGKIEVGQEKKIIPQEAKDDLSLFVRPIHDIDVINVSRNIIDNSRVNVDGRIKNRMASSLVQKAIPDIEQLFKDQTSFLVAFSNIDSLEEGRKINNHRVAKIKLGNGTDIYIAAPDALIAHKLEETIELSAQNNNGEKYEKDIRDLATMISGISKIYDKKELSKSVFETIQEKDNSHFNEHRASLVEVFKTITSDISSYASEEGLHSTLSITDIRDVLEMVQCVGKDYMGIQENAWDDGQKSVIEVSKTNQDGDNKSIDGINDFTSKLRSKVKTTEDMATEIVKADDKEAKSKHSKTQCENETHSEFTN